MNEIERDGVSPFPKPVRLRTWPVRPRTWARFFGNSLSPLWCSAQLARAQVYWNHFLRRTAFSGGLRRASQRAAGAEGVVSHQSGSLGGGRHQYDGRQRQPAAGAVHAGQRANQDCAH